MTEPDALKRRYQFSLAALLFLILSVSGTLAGYRVGFHQGYVGGELKRQSEEPFPKVYAVTDLVMPKDADASTAIPDFDSLVQTISSNVDYDTWEEVGGPGTIRIMPVNQTLVICQTKDVHERIEELLRQMRERGLLAEDDQ